MGVLIRCRKRKKQVKQSRRRLPLWGRYEEHGGIKSFPEKEEGGNSSHD
jgi:hypothetical protein